MYHIMQVSLTITIYGDNSLPCMEKAYLPYMEKAHLPYMEKAHLPYMEIAIHEVGHLILNSFIMILLLCSYY